MTKMKYEKPVVGQEVFVTGPRHFRDGMYKISKVGRLYFYTGSNFRPHPYNICDWRGSSNHCAGDYQAYPTKEHYDRKIEHTELITKIRDALGGYGNKDWISLESLREIKRIIDVEKEQS